MFSTLRTLLLALLVTSCASSPNSVNQVVVVETVVASVDAHEIELLVTSPLERAINGLMGVTEIRSRTIPGSSRIEVSYANAPSQQSLKQVESAVLAEWAKLEPFASKPVIAISSSTLHEDA